MKRNSSFIFVSLLALVFSACTTSPKKRNRKSTTSESSQTSQTTSSTGSATETKATDTSTGTVTTSPTTSGTSEGPTTSGTGGSPTTTGTSVGPTTTGTSVGPTSTGTTSIPTSGTTYVPPTPHPTDDYDDCEEAYNNNDPTALYAALRSYKSSEKPGTYDDLWNLFKYAYVREDGKIFDYYSCITNFRPGTDQAGSYKEEGDVYNREHSIPKSWYGHENPVSYTQSCDPFILVPTDGWVNSMRSNYTFGVVGSVSKHSAQNFCKLGTGDSDWGYSGTVFEPDDSLKGDFARIMFYSIAKYDVSGSTWRKGDGSENYSGDTSQSGNFGLTNYAVKLFSAWSQLDPVSEWEMQVNNKVEEWDNYYYGWRNPFIDHPEYANVLFGNNPNYTPYNP